MNIKINNSKVQNVKVCQKCRKRPLLKEHVRQWGPNGTKDFANFLHKVRGAKFKKGHRARFSQKNLGSEILGVLGDFGPKIVNFDFFLENGSNDFSNFLHEVRGL